MCTLCGATLWIMPHSSLCTAAQSLRWSCAYAAEGKSVSKPHVLNVGGWHKPGIRCCSNGASCSASSEAIGWPQAGSSRRNG